MVPIAMPPGGKIRRRDGDPPRTLMEPVEKILGVVEQGVQRSPAFPFGEEGPCLLRSMSFRRSHPDRGDEMDLIVLRRFRDRLRLTPRVVLGTGRGVLTDPLLGRGPSLVRDPLDPEVRRRR